MASGESVNHTPELHTLINRMDRLRDGFKRRVRNPFVALPDMAAKQGMVTAAMTGLTGNEEFAMTFLKKQTGATEWQLSPEDLEGLPERARERMETGIRDRANVLWPWLLLATDQGRTQADEYLSRYREAASSLSLFPFEPALESVPRQRRLDWRHRYLAAELLFIQTAIEMPDITVAASPILTMISRAEEAYKQNPLAAMQEAVLAKASIAAVHIHDSLQTEDMWNNPDDVALMCVDRGLREVVLAHYGVMRDVRLPSVSGYHTGQGVMVLKPFVNRCLRVA